MMNKSPEELQIIYDAVYSVSQLAKLLQIRPETIYKMVREDKIPHIHLSETSQIRFAGWQIRNWLDDLAQPNNKNAELA